jgi:hypothetical protein
LGLALWNFVVVYATVAVPTPPRTSLEYVSHCDNLHLHASFARLRRPFIRWFACDSRHPG